MFLRHLPCHLLDCTLSALCSIFISCLKKVPYLSCRSPERVETISPSSSGRTAPSRPDGERRRSGSESRDAIYPLAEDGKNVAALSSLALLELYLSLHTAQHCTGRHKLILKMGENFMVQSLVQVFKTSYFLLSSV